MDRPNLLWGDVTSGDHLRQNFLNTNLPTQLNPSCTAAKSDYAVYRQRPDCATARHPTNIADKGRKDAMIYSSEFNSELCATHVGEQARSQYTAIKGGKQPSGIENDPDSSSDDEPLSAKVYPVRTRRTHRILPSFAEGFGEVSVCDTLLPESEVLSSTPFELPSLLDVIRFSNCINDVFAVHPPTGTSDHGVSHLQLGEHSHTGRLYRNNADAHQKMARLLYSLLHAILAI